ncbi:MAG: hypothetical protein J6T52_11560 [Bacteroidaceae bacterium]|nr:hypothetical protein [Bacteroidaceae bacterium]
MTEEEKKEFEEFLKWKAEKAKLEEQDKQVEAEKPEEETGDNDVVFLLSQQQNTTNTNNDVKKENNNPILIIALGIAAILILIYFVVVLSNKKEVALSAELEEDVLVVDTADAFDVDSILPCKSKVVWDFSIEKDEMTDSKNIWASIISDNSISQDFPYEGLTFAKITIRYMKKYGFDAIISITKGQIHGNRYNGNNYITARFDDRTPKKYYYNEAADGSSEMVFISSKSDFIKKCKQAKDIKIDIPIFQAGRPLFIFHVDEPLVWRNE